MNIYALIKFIASIDSVDSRKRLQKCLFFIQAAGYDLGAKYDIHFYGPYSRDVAKTVDLLTQNHYLEEDVADNGCGGVQYSYKVTERAKEEVETEERKTKVQEIPAKYISLFKYLNTEELWPLELASTIALYRHDCNLSWTEAKKKTAVFKRVNLQHRIMDQAEQLAREILNEAA